MWRIEDPARPLGAPRRPLSGPGGGWCSVADLVGRVGQEASDLGHRRIGSEHLLLALLGTESASGEALSRRAA